MNIRKNHLSKILDSPDSGNNEQFSQTVEYFKEYNEKMCFRDCLTIIGSTNCIIDSWEDKNKYWCYYNDSVLQLYANTPEGIAKLARHITNKPKDINTAIAVYQILLLGIQGDDQTIRNIRFTPKNNVRLKFPKFTQPNPEDGNMFGLLGNYYFAWRDNRKLFDSMTGDTISMSQQSLFAGLKKILDEFKASDSFKTDIKLTIMYGNEELIMYYILGDYAKMVSVAKQSIDFYKEKKIKFDFGTKLMQTVLNGNTEAISVGMKDLIEKYVWV
jgi:hypothetical protein